MAKPPKRILQNCPLCNQPNEIFMQGLVRSLYSGTVQQCEDRGYSFCNCRNIFYTDWKNINIFNFKERFRNRLPKEIVETETSNAIDLVKSIFPDVESFYDVFKIDKKVRDTAKNKGMKVDKLKTYDLLYASYYFNRVENIPRELKKCHAKLNQNKYMYISMPNTKYIDFDRDNSIDFDWYVSENYTLWNLDDFTELLEENKFKVIESKNGLAKYKTENKEWVWRKDFQLIAQKV